MSYNGSSGNRDLPKYIEISKLKELMEKAREDSRRDYLIIKFLFHTGVRVSELIDIRKKDIKDGIVEVRDGKGGKDRTVPIDEELEDLIGFYTEDMSINDKLFDMTRQNVDRIVKKYRDKVDELEEASAHMIRHSFGVHCVKSGTNLRAIQKFLGHSSLTTTQIYLDLAGKDLKIEHNKAFGKEEK